MKQHVIVFCIVVAFLFAAPRAASHHSFAAVFDRESPIRVTGTVTKIEWMNPHVWIYLDVANEEGKVENWGFEMGTPNGLLRRGWSHDTLKAAQTIVIDGFMAKAELRTGAVRSVTLSTGERLFGAQDESK